ncbi:hypothetical protein L5M28_19210 [Shewanella sp. SW32]|uniref:hypothetical protein n=1 Tax=unclassified Shewanella TaxID=196818 RepID=UPI0021D7DE32|nr:MULTISPECIES: hypothetical protein [unclassified Shewanella]MCU7964680.1 hypothetical protein [Shewanella sp. SW32]MCU7972605.1 hypothetical protein [Shewanella sp. SW29]
MKEGEVKKYKAFPSTSDLVADTPNSIASVTRREAIHGGSTMTSMSSKVTSAVEFAFGNFWVICCI